MSHLAEGSNLPVWAPRVEKHKIRRLYQDDARGIHDDALIDDVGYSLLARCKSFIGANEARMGRVACPGCGNVIRHTSQKEQVLHCEDCGWELTWGEYFKTIQHTQLSGAKPVLDLFDSFVKRFPAARTARDKVLLIDELLHGFHIYYKDHSVTRPVAVNLIDGKLGEVIAFLDELTYSKESTPGLAATYAEWDRRVKRARDWGEKQGGRQ